jgi:hypothetical protein
MCDNKRPRASRGVRGFLLGETRPIHFIAPSGSVAMLVRESPQRDGDPEAHRFFDHETAEP